jgi:hypothetical protein
MHTRSLSLVAAPPDRAIDAGTVGEETDGSRELLGSRTPRPTLYAATANPLQPEPTCVVEQRFSGLLHSMLLFCIIFVMPLVGKMPVGLLWGGYLLLASEAFGTTFVQRILACLSSTNMRQSLQDSEGLKDLLDKISYSTMVRFTSIQFALWLFLFVTGVVLKELVPFDKDHLGNIWVMTGMFLPLITMMYAIPFRSHLLTKWFDPSDLCCLDHENEGEEENGRLSMAGQNIEGVPAVAIRTSAGNPASMPGNDGRPSYAIRAAAEHADTLAQQL